MPIVSSGVAPMPTLKKSAGVHKPSQNVIDLTKALNELPADGQTFILTEGKTAKGISLVCGKIAARNGYAIRTQIVSDTSARIWKIALNAEQLQARDAKKLKAKEAKAKKEAANLAEMTA